MSNLAAWLADRQTDESKHKLLFVIFVLDGPEMSGFDSFIASHEIRISFLIHMHILFFPPLFSVTIFSDITIILISNNLYPYLLKLLQINAPVSQLLFIIITYCWGKLLSTDGSKSRWSDTQSVDVRLLKKPAAVEQHVGAWGLHKVLLHLSDRRVIEMVPGPSYGTVAQRRVVAHVQVACVVLEKANRRLWFLCSHINS